MAGQDRVALFDIHLNFTSKTEVLEEAVDRGHVVVVLVLGRFLRLGLDQDRALEAHLVLIIDDHLKHAPGLLALASHVGVEQGFIAFAPTPQHVVLAAEFDRRVHAGFDRGRRKGKDIRVGVGRCSRHETPVREQVRSAPKQFGAGVSIFCEIIDHRFEVAGFLAKSRLRGAHRRRGSRNRARREFEHLEGHIRLHLGSGDRVAQPRTVECAPPNGSPPGHAN